MSATMQGGWVGSLTPCGLEDRQNAMQQSGSNPDSNTVIQHQHAMQRAVCSAIIATGELEQALLGRISIPSRGVIPE